MVLHKRTNQTSDNGTPMNSPETLTFSVPEIAKLLSISCAHAYALVARKELPRPSTRQKTTYSTLGDRRFTARRWKLDLAILLRQ
jgi:hypothetical protein